jgi:hypothetical protein
MPSFARCLLQYNGGWSTPAVAQVIAFVYELKRKTIA